MVEKPFRQGSWPPPDSDARPSLRAPRGGVSIRWQLLALALLAVVVIFGLGNQIATRTLEHILAVESNEEQSRRVAMLVAAFSTSNELPSQTQLDVLARASNAKLSLLSADGKVLAEAGETPAQAGSARVAEEEFTKALVRDDADVTSSTRVLEHTLMTIVKLGTREVSFLRVETPIHRADATIERFRGLTLAAALVALVLSALFIEGVVRRISADVKDLRDTAIRMARGDLFAGAAPPVPNAIPELRELGVALARVAENLSSALSQLASDRDLFGSVLDGMREGVLVLDRDGRIALANPAFRQTLLLPHTVVGKLPELAIDSPPLVEILEHAHRQRRQVTGEISVGRLMPRRLAIHAAPVAASSGATLAVFVDVTELRKFETMRRDFVANVSHELRTPITVIRATAETLEQSNWGDEMAYDFVAIIERNAQRLQRLVDDLLDLSRMDSGKARLDIEQVSVDALLKTVLAAHQEQARRRGVRFVIQIGAEAQSVEADRGALEQILSNLVENEVKYASGKSTVTVATAVEDEQFVITISDSGPGIAEQHLPRLFERFYRVDAGRSRELGGTGLGLAIVKHLLEAHSGSISVESELGKGTTFRLVLPRNRALLLERQLESVPLESPVPEGVDAARLSQPDLL